ncbi:autotransporter domain-containing protein [Neisseriaceae bacterium PsAf]|nr:autotransporter domain-containing protein [Neisseriaceae bacterium PsAf]
MVSLNQKQICFVVASSFVSSLALADNQEIVIPIQEEDVPSSSMEHVIEPINKPYPSSTPTPPSQTQETKGYTELDPVVIEDKAIKIVDYDELCEECSNTGAIAAAVLQGSLIVAGFIGNDGRDQASIPQISEMKKPERDAKLTGLFRDEIRFGESAALPLLTSSALLNSLNTVKAASSFSILSGPVSSLTSLGSVLTASHVSSLISLPFSISIQSLSSTSLASLASMTALTTSGLSVFTSSLSASSLYSILAPLSPLLLPIKSSGSILSFLPFSSAILLGSSALPLSLSSSLLSNTPSVSSAVVTTTLATSSLLSSTLSTIAPSSALVSSGIDSIKSSLVSASVPSILMSIPSSLTSSSSLISGALSLRNSIVVSALSTSLLSSGVASSLLGISSLGLIPSGLADLSLASSLLSTSLVPIVIFTSSVTLFSFLAFATLGSSIAAFGSGLFSILSVPLNSSGGFLSGSLSLLASMPFGWSSLNSSMLSRFSFGSSSSVPAEFFTMSSTLASIGSAKLLLGSLSVPSSVLSSSGFASLLPVSVISGLPLLSSAAPSLISSAGTLSSSIVSTLISSVGWGISVSVVGKSILESSSVASWSLAPLSSSASLILGASSAISSVAGLSSLSSFVIPSALSLSSASFSVPSTVLSLVDLGLATSSIVSSLAAPLVSSLFTVLPALSLGVFFVGASLASSGGASALSLVPSISILGGSIVGPILSSSSIPALFSASSAFIGAGISALVTLVAAIPFSISSTALLSLSGLEFSSSVSSGLTSLPSSILSASSFSVALFSGVPLLILASLSGLSAGISSIYSLSALSSSWVPSAQISYSIGSSVASSLTPSSVLVPILSSSSVPLSISSVPSLISASPFIASMISSGLGAALSSQSSFSSLGSGSASLSFLNPISVSGMPVVSSITPSIGLSLLGSASLSQTLGASSSIPSLSGGPLLSGLGSTSVAAGLLWSSSSSAIVSSSILPFSGISLIPATSLASVSTAGSSLLTSSLLQSSFLTSSSASVSQLSWLSSLSFIPAYGFGASSIVSSLAPITSIPASLSGPLVGSSASIINLGLSTSSSLIDSSGKILSSISLLPNLIPLSVTLSSALSTLGFGTSSALLSVPPLATLSLGGMFSSIALNSSTAPLGLSFSSLAAPVSLVSALPSVLFMVPASGITSSVSLASPSTLISSSFGSGVNSIASIIGLPALSAIGLASLAGSTAASSLVSGLGSLIPGVSAYYSMVVSLLSPLSISLSPISAIASSTTLGAISLASGLGIASSIFSGIFSSELGLVLPTISTFSLGLSSLINPSSIVVAPITSVVGILSMVTAVTSGLFLAFGVVSFFGFLPVSLLATISALSGGVSSVFIASSSLAPVLPLSSSALLSTSASSALLIPSSVIPLASSISSGVIASSLGAIPASISGLGSLSFIPSSMGLSGLSLASSVSASGLPFYSSLSSGLGLISSMPIQSSNIAASLSVVPSSVVSSIGSSLSSAGSASLPGLAPTGMFLSSSAVTSSSMSSMSLLNSISSAPSLASSLPFKSSAGLIGTSSALNSSLIPVSSMAGPISSSMIPLAPITASSALPASSSSSWTPISSGLPSLASGLPSSSSLAPSASQVSVMGPFASASIGGLSFRLFGPKRLSNWKYGFHEYDYFADYGDFEFRNLVTFGDSLSDTGSFGRGSIYMADGNPYVFYNSYLSLVLTGKVITPERFGGANYAMSGAVLRNDPLDPMSWIIPRDSLKDQVDRYLEKNSGVAHKDDAFVIWGGGNDLTSDIQYAVLNPGNWSVLLNGPTPNQAYMQAYMNDKADMSGILAQKLIDHGAEGPIFVMNLPSPAYTAFPGVLLESTMDLGLFTNGTPLNFLNVGGWLMKAQDDFLRNPANRVGDLANGGGIAYFRENNINAIHHRYPFIPRELVAFYFDKVFNASNNVTRWFNQAQANRTAQVDGNNVVQLDIDGLFQEVMDNPLIYGIDEILVPECTIGQVAPACDEGDVYYHGNDGRRYMYTDWHHPSALMHRIIAEYAIATVNAPAYMTGLSRSLETGTKARQDYLLSELTRINARPYEGQGQTYVFGGFSGGYSKQSRSLNNKAVVYSGLNIGVGYRPFQELDIGVMGSLGLSKMKPHHTLKYDQQDLGLTGFAQYTVGPWWINGNVSFAHTQFDNIKRTIPLGEHARVEHSETKGKSYGFRIETGYEFLVYGNSWIVAPMLAYSQNRYEVDGFEEDGMSSTAMKFKKQKRDVNVVTVGVRISDDCPDDSAFMRGTVDITLNKNVNKNKNKIEGEGGLKRYPSTFTREANRLVKDSSLWVEIKPTVQFKLDKNSKITTSVNYSIDKNKAKSKNLSYSIGYRYEF